jgi:DNA-binding GntR family transcriptional regulator
MSRTVPATPRQKAVEDFIRAYRHRHDGISPTEAEIGKALGISRSTARNLLVSLEKRGRIRRSYGRGRTIELVT